MARYRDFRGVCDISEDGYGGFTMDSVYCDGLKGEKYVTSIFRLKSEVEAEENGVWKPDNFNFKAAVGGSPSKGKSKKKEATGEKIKKIHHSKKMGSKQTEETKVSQVRRHLGEVFEGSFTDVMEDVTNRLEEITGDVDGIKIEGQEKEKHKKGDKASDESNKHNEEYPDEKWVCREYVRKVTEFYDSLDMPSTFSFESMNNGDPKEKNKEKETAVQGTEEDEDNSMEEMDSEEKKKNF